MATTIADLIARRARVYWTCQECRASADVDLPAVLAAKGPTYDLTDKTAACRTAGCGYWVSFYAQDGQRNTPLRTEAGLMRMMDRRTAWLRASWSRQQKGPAIPKDSGASNASRGVGRMDGSRD